jgi:hypothetical protein
MTRVPYASRVKALLTLSLVSALAIGCHKNKDAEGPMERAGKSVDKAAEKTGEALEKAADKTGEALEKAGQKMQGEDDKAEPAPAEAEKK